MDNSNQTSNLLLNKEREMNQSKEHKHIRSLKAKNSQKRVRKQKLNIKKPITREIRYFSKVNFRIFLNKYASLIDK
jgi:hypothetical protein